MTHNRYRIPRATKAALLLGGAACGGGGDDPPGGSTEGLNTSSSRINAIAKAYCEQYEDCYSDGFEMSYANQAECVDAIADNFAEEPNKKCLDAALDYFSCYTQIDCKDIDDVDEKCGELYDSYAEACGLDDGDYTSISGHAPSRVKRAHLLVRKYRIPR